MAEGKNYFVLVTGDRDWDNERLMRKVLEQYPYGTWLMHGNARGADQMAGQLCQELSFIEIIVPYIGYLQRRGGPARNGVMKRILISQILDFQLRVEAFHTDIENSKGTANMLRQMKRYDLPIRLNGKYIHGR